MIAAQLDSAAVVAEGAGQERSSVQCVERAVLDAASPLVCNPHHTTLPPHAHNAHHAHHALGRFGFAWSIAR